MFSYSITHNILSTGDATISIKQLKTKICSESLKFLLLKVNLEGISLNILSIRFSFCNHSCYLLWSAVFQFCSLEKETVQKKNEYISVQQAGAADTCNSKSNFGLHLTVSQQQMRPSNKFSSQYST